MNAKTEIMIAKFMEKLDSRIEYVTSNERIKIEREIVDIVECELKLFAISNNHVNRAQSFEHVQTRDELFKNKTESSLNTWLNYKRSNKKFIHLTRSDLQRMKETKHIDEITIYDFKSSAMTYDEIRKAKSIIFIDDDEKLKILK